MDIESIYNDITKEDIEQEYAFDKEENLHLDFKYVDGNFSSNDDKRMYGGNSNIVIHPNTVLEVIYAYNKVSKATTVFPNLYIEYKICAEGCKMIRGIKEILSQDIYFRVYPQSEVEP
jgi:hypothetical protein